MKRREKRVAEPESERTAEDRSVEARQFVPCPKRLEAETAESKPGAAGLALRSARPKC